MYVPAQHNICKSEKEMAKRWGAYRAIDVVISDLSEHTRNNCHEGGAHIEGTVAVLQTRRTEHTGTVATKAGTVADEGDRARRDSCHDSSRHTNDQQRSRFTSLSATSPRGPSTSHQLSHARVTHITTSRSESGSHTGHQPLHTQGTQPEILPIARHHSK